MLTGSLKKKARRVTIIGFIALWLLNLILLPSFNGAKVDGKGSQGIRSCNPSLSFEGTIFALTTGNTLLNFNPGTPGVINSARYISGLASGENIVGIDFRPANGLLYALSSANRIYIVNPTSGFTTLVGTSPFTPALNGSSFGVDFNPVPDRLRVVSNTDQNLRLNPNNGAVAGVDSILAYAAGDVNAGQDPSIVGAAYTNNFAGASSTTLYGIDSNLDVLVTQGSVGGSPVSPNTGQLFTVGKLNVDTTDLVGFDIAPVSNAAFVSLTPQGATSSQFYTLNLATGATTLIGAIGGDELIRDIAFAVRADNVFAVTDDNVLLSFNAGTPGAINSARRIYGLEDGEDVLGIDFRPATGQLYAVTSASRIYIINTASGNATPVGTAPFNPTLVGLAFGVDFNPVPDRIRVISDADQNLRLNPNNGAVAGVDTTLAYAPDDVNAGQNPSAVAAAYTNNFVGSTSTTLYVIDSVTNTLATQGSIGGAPVSPNTGRLFTVGSLGVDPTNIAGFDISSATGAAFASLNMGGGLMTQLYSINLATGAAGLIGTIGGDSIIRDIAVETRVPNVFAVTASNNLISFNAGTPGVISSIRAIKGLSGGETIIGIDARPATGQIYAVTSASRVYIINPSTAVASWVNFAGFNPALNGIEFGFDFNPVPDRIRVVSDANQNLRLNPNNGAVAGTDTPVAFASTDVNAGAAPTITGSAYTNNFIGATSTTLYGIASNLGVLVTQGSVGGAPISPNTGQLFTVGSLGVPASGMVGFDIAPLSNAAFASLTAAGSATSQLYAVNLTTGAATLIGAIGVNEPVRALTIASAARSVGFDICLQDDRSGDILQINSCSGDYQFTRCGTGGFTIIGRGSISAIGNNMTLDDLKVTASIDTTPLGRRTSGSALIRPFGIGPSITLTDRDTADNTCSCR